MLTAEQISKQVHEHVQGKIQVFPCNNLRASNIGHPCERYLYLLIRNWDEQQSHGESLQNIFDLGNAIEAYTIDKLKASGLEVVTPVKRSWKIESPVITGREDIRIKDTETGELIPAEIKGLAPYEWERLNSIEDFYKSRRHYVRGYPAQLMVYMLHFGKNNGFFVLTNKLTGELKIIDVPFDRELADALIEKAGRIYDALAGTSDIPPGCDDLSVCERCSLRHICTAPHERTETDVDDGELEEAIDRREALREAYRGYIEADAEVKRIFGSRQKVLAGKYLAQEKVIEKGEYTVKARTERRVDIKRL